MRMWMINPKLLCDQHLRGEHGELHKHRTSFVRKHRITNRVRPEDVQIEPLSMATRHDEVAAEMVRRGMNHNSPYTMPDLSYLSDKHVNATVNPQANIVILMRRCHQCRLRIIRQCCHSEIHDLVGQYLDLADRVNKEYQRRRR